MALDPSIPLQAKGIDIAGGAAKFLQLDEMAQGIAMQRYQMQQAMDNERKRRAIAALYSSPGAYDEKGLPSLKTIQQVFAIDPNAGEKVMNMRSTLESREEQRQKMMTDEAGKRKGLRLEYAQFYKSAYDDFLDKNPNNTEGAKNFARQQYMGKADRDQKSGAVPWMTDQLWKNFLQNSPNDPVAYEAEIKAGQGAREFTQDMDSKALAKRLSDMEKGGSPEPGKDSTIETGFDAQGNPYIKKDAGQVALSQVGNETMGPETQDKVSGAVTRSYEPNVPEGKALDVKDEAPPVTQPAPPEEGTNIEAPAVQMEGKRAESNQAQLERLQRRRDNAAKMGGTAGDKEVKRVEAQIKDLQTDIQKDTSADQKERFHEDNVKLQNQRLNIAQERLKIAQQYNKPIPQEDMDFAVKTFLETGNNALLTGYARYPQAKMMVLPTINRMRKELNISGPQLAARMAAWEGIKAGAKATEVDAARIQQAGDRMSEQIKLARTAGADVWRSPLRPINEVWQLGAGMGSESEAKFKAANEAIINDWAALAGRGGTPTVHNRQEAEKMLRTANSHPVYNAVLDMLEQEKTAVINGNDISRKSLEERIIKMGWNGNDFTGPKKGAAQDMTGKPGGSPVIKWNDLK